MTRTRNVIVGLVLVVLGVVWTLQGTGRLGGSVMSGVTFWAVVGPIVALAGLVLALRGRGGGRSRRGSGPDGAAPPRA